MPLLLLLLLLFIPTAWSQPWIQPDNMALRSQITYLQQQNIIHAPINTWPLAWQSIAEDLNHCRQQAKISVASLCENLWQQYQAQQKTQLNFTAYAANDQSLLNDFDTRHRGKSGTQLSASSQNEYWSGQITLNQVDAATDHNALNLDNTYLALHSDNWALGAGKLDHWWGPGWDSALIWSTNARPIPGLFLTRTSGQSTNFPILNFLGPWHFSGFLGQLENNRSDIPRPLFLGMRLNFKPWTPLEIGLSRTAQWGGKGREQNLSVLSHLLIGQDNTGGAQEPGNQLAGFDATLSFPIKDYTTAFYFEYIGEDEAGGFPAKSLGLSGASLSYANNILQWTSFLEASDTAVNVLSSDEFNVAYEHHLYTDGYRYDGRAIGSTYDNDAHTLTLGFTGTINKIHQLSAKASLINFNLDNAGIQSDNGNGLVKGGQYTHLYAVRYQQNLSSFNWGLGFQHFTQLPANKVLVDKADNLSVFVSKDFK